MPAKVKDEKTKPKSTAKTDPVIEMLPIDALKEYAKNPRRIPDEAITAVAKSIEAFGFRVPVIVDGDNVLICGHTRCRAARQLGLKTIPALRAADLTPQQINGFRLADNQLSTLTSFDDEMLKLELMDLKEFDFDLNTLGFSEVDLSRLLDPDLQPGLTDANEIPPLPAEPITKLGDLWVLGEHRLLCGDSTSHDDVRRVMNGEKAALFATDPPYLVDYDGSNHPHKWNESDKIKNGSESSDINWDDAKANPDLFDKFIEAAVANAILHNAAWYCWHASRRQAMLEEVWTKHGAFVHQQIIWNKDRPILTRSWYMWRHEPCLFGWVRPNKPLRYAEDHPHSVWDVPTIPAGTQTDHPTSKPVQLFIVPMQQHTKTGDICFEPFSGSGSQIIAAEQLKRKCYAIEISPTYVDVAVQRWEKFTGQKAKRIAAGKK